MIKEKSNNSKLSMKKRRGISEVIVTLLLLAVTVSGGALISAFFLGDSFTSSGGDTGGIGVSLTEESRSIHDVLITGYDTRDGADLSGIAALDNVSNSLLCSKSCGSTTDYIVINIRNKNPAEFFISGVQVNDAIHTFDTSTAGVLLGTSFPAEGTFSIIPERNDETLTQFSVSEVKASDNVRLVIRLSNDMNEDIQLNKAIRIVFDTSIIKDAQTVVIQSGSVS